MCALKRRETDTAIPHDDRGNALTDLRQHLRLRQHEPVVMRMNVDESGRNDASPDIDYVGVTRRQA